MNITFVCDVMYDKYYRSNEMPPPSLLLGNIRVDTRSVTDDPVGVMRQKRLGTKLRIRYYDYDNDVPGYARTRCNQKGNYRKRFFFFL